MLQQMFSKERLKYDANFSIGKFRGMGKFINKFCDVLSSKFDIETKGLLRSGVKEVKCTSFGFSNYILWEQISLPNYLSKSKSINIFPYNTAPIFLKKSTRNVLIIHDLIFFQKYKTTSVKQLIGKYYRRFIIPLIVKKFDHIITVSNYSKTQLVEKFDVHPNIISVIPNSVHLNIKRENPSFEQRSNVIFHIGGEPDYKNTKAVILAYNMLPYELKSKYSVKIVGIRNKKSLREFRQVSKGLNIDEQIEFLPYQTDKEIELLYLTSKIFVFPSYYEGFGIPIIEAYNYGCPLICSNQSCLPEIAGNGARYFSPDNIEELKNAIVDTIVNKNDTLRNINKGYEQLSRYNNESFEKAVENWYLNYRNKLENIF